MSITNLTQLYLYCSKKRTLFDVSPLIYFHYSDRDCTSTCNRLSKNISIRVDSNMLLKIVAHTINKRDYVWHTMFRVCKHEIHFVPSGNGNDLLKMWLNNSVFQEGKIREWFHSCNNFSCCYQNNKYFLQIL